MINRNNSNFCWSQIVQFLLKRLDIYQPVESCFDNVLGNSSSRGDIEIREIVADEVEVVVADIEYMTCTDSRSSRRPASLDMITNEMSIQVKHEQIVDLDHRSFLEREVNLNVVIGFEVVDFLVILEYHHPKARYEIQSAPLPC